ncbi:RTC4-like domain-containing protein [Lipomyces kononenkoae]|uniref:RTC4-like domain-containing protein n=1 Tax=Lipomyces kononenkoae TaxID=34357 RepID=A0ACC3T174_LIPKO
MSRTTQSSLEIFSGGRRPVNSTRHGQSRDGRSDQNNPPRIPSRVRDGQRVSTNSIYPETTSHDISSQRNSTNRPSGQVDFTNLGSDDELRGSQIKRQKTTTETQSRPQTMSVTTLTNFLSSSPRQSSSLSSSQAVPFKEMMQSAMNNPNKVIRTSEWQSGGSGPLRTSWNRQCASQDSKEHRSTKIVQTYARSRKTRRIRGHGASIEMSDTEQEERPTQMRRNPGADSSPDELLTAPVSEISSQQTSPEKPGIQLDLFKQLLDSSTTMINEVNQKVVDVTIPDKAIDDNDYLSSSPPSSQLAAIEAIEMNHSLNEHERLIRNFDDKIQLRTCPMCGQEVSDAVRERFKAVPDSLRRSYAICTSHRREATLAESSGKNYPTELDEGVLAERAEKYVSILSDIINENRPSVFQERAKASGLVQGGRRMDALLQMENGLDDLLPGYYGLKGSSVLLRVALRSSENEIRRASRRNRWITNVSITGYASAVLVPELAIRLIMEDQNVDEEKAEMIRQDSLEYGRIVFGHERDMFDQSDNDQGEDESKAKKVSRKKKHGDRDADKMTKKKPESNLKIVKKGIEPVSLKSVKGIPSSFSTENATLSPQFTVDHGDPEDTEGDQSQSTPTKTPRLTSAAVSYEADLAKTESVVAASLDILKMFELQK